MGRPSSSKPSPAQLRDAYITNLASAWRAQRAKRPAETPYAFVLYGVEGSPAWLTPQVLTEEGLTQVAQRYLDEGSHETLDASRDALRWSVADAPAYRHDDHATLPTVSALFEPHAKSLDETEGYRLLAKAATDALAALDKQGLFGKSAARANVLLAILTEDTEEDFATPSAKRLNSREAFKRFEKQTRIEGVFGSTHALAVSPDGVSLYFAGSRGGDDSVNEVVALDLRGRRLVRRWAFPFPTFGDSVRALRCTGDGTSLFALRCQYEEAGAKTLVMRFGHDGNKPVAQHAFAAEPAGFAITPDGARCAVSERDGRLVLLGEDLRPIREHELPGRLYGLQFVSPRDLLVASDKAILRLDPESDAAPTVAAELPSFRFSADDGGRLLAVSAVSFDVLERVRRPFGVHLLQLPTLERLGTFEVPGHQCMTVALSPDGKRLAFEAHDTASVRKHVVVFDVASGKELARRRADSVQDLAFLRDNRTLAIGASGFVTGEPVELWAVPEA